MRKTNPTTWQKLFVFAVLSTALGLNFIFLTPTFMPFDMPKWPIGLLLVGCGVAKLTLLLVNGSPVIWIRSSMALTVSIYSFWGAILTFEFFRLDQTSLQLPLTYIALALLGVLLLMDPFSNPPPPKVSP